MKTLLFTGDFCPHGRIAAIPNANRLDNLYKDIVPDFAAADFKVVNLEAPVLPDDDSPIKKIGPALHCYPRDIEFLRDLKTSLASLANNHFKDYGTSGIVKTLQCCKDYGIETIGGGVDSREISQPFYWKNDEGTVAFLNFCENEFSTASDNSPGANPLDPIKNYYQIQNARRNADKLIVIVHGGHEMYQLPSPRMKQTYRFFIDTGADVVIGHHAHCFSGYEKYRNKLIFYSLGNFSFDWPGRHTGIWNEGYMVRLRLNAGHMDFELLPYVQGRENPGISYLSSSEQKEFHQKIDHLNQIIADDTALQNNFAQFCNKNYISSLGLFEPFGGRYFNWLRKRGLLPSFLSKRKRMLALNMVRCEAHRDCLLENLKKGV